MLQCVRRYALIHMFLHTYRAMWDKKCRISKWTVLTQPAVSLSPAASICFSFSLVLWNNLHSVVKKNEGVVWVEWRKSWGVAGWRGRCSSCGGTRQHNSISHVGEGVVGVQAAGAAHSGIVIRGGGMQLIRLREMYHSLKSSPWEALTQNTRVAVRLLELEGFKRPHTGFKITYFTIVRHHTIHL